MPFRISFVNIHVPKKRRPPFSKVNARSTFGCFIGYHSSVSYKLWDFERKYFVITRDVQFEETQFPKASDYGEPPADPYNHSRQRRHKSPSPLPEPKPNRPLYGVIIPVIPPPALEVFAT